MGIQILYIRYIKRCIVWQNKLKTKNITITKSQIWVSCHMNDLWYNSGIKSGIKKQNQTLKLDGVFKFFPYLILWLKSGL